jgi:hypothetical protein
MALATNAATFTIGDTEFGTLKRGGRRCAISCFIHDPKYVVHRFHPPGCNGNFLIRDGREGASLVATIAYVDTYDQALAYYNEDMAKWENAPVKIIDECGDEFENCNLMSMRPLGRPKGTGDGRCILYAQATFTWDG